MNDLQFFLTRYNTTKHHRWKMFGGYLGPFGSVEATSDCSVKVQASSRVGVHSLVTPQFSLSVETDEETGVSHIVVSEFKWGKDDPQSLDGFSEDWIREAPY